MVLLRHICKCIGLNVFSYFPIRRYTEVILTNISLQNAYIKKSVSKGLKVYLIKQILKLWLNLLPFQKLPSSRDGNFQACFLFPGKIGPDIGPLFEHMVTIAIES